jgi:hypothetical protein
MEEYRFNSRRLSVSTLPEYSKYIKAPSYGSQNSLNNNGSSDGSCNNARFPRYSVSMPIIGSPAFPPIARTRDLIQEFPPTYQVTGSFVESHISGCRFNQQSQMILNRY